MRAALFWFLRLMRAYGQGVYQPWRLAVRHRLLLRQLLARDAIIQTAGTHLGRLWLLLGPGLQILAWWFVFDAVLRVRPMAHFSFLDYFLPTVLPWLFVQETLSRCLSLLREVRSLYERSVFPLVILPLLPLLLIWMVYTPLEVSVVAILHGPRAAMAATAFMILLPLLLLPWCYLFSLLGVFFPDGAYGMRFLLTLLFYFTPIIYTPQMLPEVLQDILVWNPMATLLQVLHGLIGLATLDFHHAWYPLACSLLITGPAWVLFSRMSMQIREAL
jgi:lipopolysaccharide transport system permease protein